MILSSAYVVKPLPSNLLFSDPFGSIAMQCLATSRKYLEDYNLLSDPKYLSEQTKQVVLKSVLLQAMLVMTDYTKHMEKQIEAQQRGEEIDDFDFKPAGEEFLEKVVSLSVKSGWTVVVRKFYEAICVAKLNTRLADRFTKDVGKSVLRKISKHGVWSASSRIFFTYCWPGAIRTAAVFTVDCFYALYDNTVTRKLRKVDWVEVSLWTAKRLAFHSLCMVWGAAGYAMGVIIEPKVIAVWSGALFEAGAAAVLTPLLLN